MKVLFVCTGNVFRSVIAEKCFTDYCSRHSLTSHSADSAGIRPSPQPVLESVRLRLTSYNINVEHIQKEVTVDLITNSDLVIALHRHHQDFLKENFDVMVPLYNQVAYGINSDVTDIEEKLPHIVSKENYRQLPEAYEYTQSVVDYLYRATPYLVQNILEQNGITDSKI